MTQLIRILFVACSCLGAGACTSLPRLDPGPVPAGVQLRNRLVERPIAAETLDSLRAMLRRGGQLTGEGRFPGSTRWRVGWTFDYERPSYASCTLQNVRVRLETVVMVPKWDAASARDTAAIRWWDEYITRLKEHERGHVKIAVDAAGEIARKFRDLRAADCGMLSTLANQTARDILAEHGERQRRFDRTTHHGARTTPDSLFRGGGRP